MLNSKLTRIAITVTFAFVAPHSFAGQSSWLEVQLAVSDGYSAPNASTGVEGRQGFKPASDSSWLDQQLAITDGYSPRNEAAARKSVYVGAKFESSEDEFVQRGIRITDGTTE